MIQDFSRPVGVRLHNLTPRIYEKVWCRFLVRVEVSRYNKELRIVDVRCCELAV